MSLLVLHTTDFNNTLNIADNGENYLITDKKGDKSVATLEKGVISYNNCKILVDKKENILISTCTINNKSYSNDYWSKDKVDKYLADLTKIKYGEYIENYLSIYSEEGIWYEIPTIEDLNSVEKKHLDQEKIKKNPSYPFISFGDFNNDNKYPDIAVISKHNDDTLHGENADNKLSVLHAGSKRLRQLKIGKFTPFLYKYSDIITILELRNGNDAYRGFRWNGRRYKEIKMNM